MKVAVTGAAGFIGSHVLDALARRGDVEIVAVSRREIPAGRLPPGAGQVILDIAAPTDADYDRIGRPDVLVHLAWDGLPDYLSPHHFETELPAQYRFLKMLIEGGLRSLLVTGTCYEYGMLDGELAEETIAAPASPYAHAKIALHRRLELLKASIPFALTWARLFYTWGPGQGSGSIFPMLRAAVERGDSSFPMSPGEQIRDYLAVEEMARILVALALRQEDLGPVNVCSGVPVRMRALVEQWLECNGWKIALDLGKYPYPTYEPLAFWGSTEKLERLLAGLA
jgi:dTDP-6-deoxy-L-talose 4-dehydrogenase (NAD+)